jgi:hypothetical protein
MVFKLNAVDFEQQEAIKYRPGQRVELKQRPGVVDIIVEYDPMMVPPIALANDPKPRYPEELLLVVTPKRNEWLKPAGRRKVRTFSREYALAK